ncbi:MAG: RNA methyltransferase [Acidimicrobiales bacterium]
MQQLRRLSGRRAARLEEGAFVIEGPTLVREAVEAGLRLSQLFATSEADPALVARAAAAGAEVRLVPTDVLGRALDTVTPQGIAAIAPRIDVTVEVAVAAAGAGPLVLVLVDVNDPGNAGTLVRAAEAAGASAVLFCGGSVDPWNPKCVRASAGALFQVPVAIGGEAVAVLELLGQAGVRSAATVVRDGTPYDEADLTGPLALLLGSEAHGLPAELTTAVDLRLSIPMSGRSESLNVAMAGSVLCFEALRQRRAAST